MGNEHLGKGVDNLEEDTLHDKADTRGFGEEVLHSRVGDEFYRSKNHRQEGCGV